MGFYKGMLNCVSDFYYCLDSRAFEKIFTPHYHMLIQDQMEIDAVPEA